jgi:hypothetical protein
VLRGAALQLARDSPAVVCPPFECLDEGSRAERRTGKCTEHRNHRLVEFVEPVRLEGVGREHAHNVGAIGERTAETGVDMRGAGVSHMEIDLAVKGVRQQAVWREAHGLA